MCRHVPEPDAAALRLRYCLAGAGGGAPGEATLPWSIGEVAGLATGAIFVDPGPVGWLEI